MKSMKHAGAAECAALIWQRKAVLRILLAEGHEDEQVESVTNILV